ncbi:MAG TPA: glycosyltransferase, partial [Candidatus Binatia bacterium]|nr:glycosyltransferase [Candidatus Binatia bacterium]
MAASEPTISIVIPVLNGQRTIGSCMTSILRTDYPAHRREVIVVDNGSSDATRSILDRYPVRVLSEPRRGPSIARNRGIEAATGEIVAFTDADCVASQGWLRELVRSFATGAAGVAGEILPFPPTTPAERYAARIRHLSPERYLRRATFPFAVTANLSFRRDVFERTGGFDADSPRGGESTDFCTRFSRATGERLHYARLAVVFHRHRQTTWELFRQHWGYGRGHAYLYIKYRAETPWGWRQTRMSYADLGRSSARLAGAA